MKKNGFTLIEMLLVICIIGILTTTMVVSFGRMRMTAIRSEAQKLVSDASTAFNVLLQKEREWPKVILDEMNNGMTPEVCYIFQKNKLLDVTTYDREKDGTLKPRTSGNVSLTSLDRFGLLDPWARMELKKKPSLTSDSAIATGGKSYRDHLIQYRVDKNYDGYVDSSDGTMPKSGLRIRASAIVWSRGLDGEDDGLGKSTGRYPVDDSLSWSMAEQNAK